MKDFPFTVYDFLVYIMSGAVAVLSWDYYVGYRWFTLRLDPSLLIAFYCIVSYICGHVISHFSAVVLEASLVKHVLGEPVTALTEHPGKRSIKCMLFPGYFQPLPNAIREKVRLRAQSDGYSTPLNIEFFLYSYAVTTRRQEVQMRLDHIRNQYGFARSMSISLATGAVGLFFGAGSTMLGIGMCMASCILLYRYLKFFRQYSFEVLIRYLEYSNHDQKGEPDGPNPLSQREPG